MRVLWYHSRRNENQGEAFQPHMSDTLADAVPLDEPPSRFGIVRECPECGLFQAIPSQRPGTIAECFRCEASLRRRRRNSLDVTLALNVTGLILFVVATAFPLLGLSLAGQERMTTLARLPATFLSQGLWQLTWVVLGTTILAPMMKLVLTIGVIIGLRRGEPGARLATMARWRAKLTPWAMTEVFLLGAFVAYTRLSAIATVEVGVALYALFALMLAMVASDAWLDEHALWEAIGRLLPSRPQTTSLENRGEPIGCDTCGLVSQGHEGEPCPRCRVALRHRKHESLARTWALLMAAFLCYIPANLYPVMTVIRFGQGAPSTILGGVQELIEYRMWPLAALVFIASVAVPVLKFVGLLIMLISTQRNSGAGLRDRTRLYRIVETIGRWSMIDVFMVSILAALVRMGMLASILPGLGGVFFAAVVILTMLASFSFDPRLMWDAAGAPACADAMAEGVA